MFSGQARWFLLAGLSGSALLACSSDPNPENGGGSAGMSSGGSAAGSMSTAGSTSTAGSSSTAGTQSGGGSVGTAGTSSTAGTGGAAAGSGSGGTAGASAGAGGASAGAGGGGGAAGGAAMPTAVANITGLAGKAVTGTATFTQGATMTKMVLNLTACPNGMHASHLHLNKDCGPAAGTGEAAGGHWIPNGEMLGDYTCADTKVTYEFSKPTSMWTVGDGSATDVTKYSFMVHEMGGANPGGRIGCGVVDVKK